MTSDTRASTRITLASVAREAGVSLPTVSKVLNGHHDVAEQTRERVEQVIRDTGYQRVTRRAGKPTIPVVELVFDDVVSAYSIEILRGVTDAASAHDVDVVVAKFGRFGDRRPDAELWARRSRLAGRAGIISVTTEMTSDHLDAFERARLPLVLIDPVNPPPRQDTVSVGATNWAGGMTATQHLTALGHRRIAYIGGEPGATCSQARLYGYHAALAQAGIAQDPQLVRSGHFDAETGYAATLELAALDEPPTAVFAGCDASAVGVVEAARTLGLRVPEDLSVVGFDDTYVAEHCFPKLTTIAQPLEEMGRVALRTLLRLADGDTPESHHVELATQLVERASTAPPARHQGRGAGS
ncbi:transcriptional regulator, LacI family [Friedmanniella luteola]|uniref:Transcriptional regulator, LacI family n=1 Tax=Friedmanniella luteola TaxID=546871 RepID=A0A1H1ZKV4_9ACTN|nr:LacI family DNA-binding transcriptional regulator [Friedmanniella luteola]SDT34283.1 transcriptional regulator, LacI family [Friedmanniella luteola]